MKLTFMYQRVTDLQSALAFYRDELGLAEAWREGESTVAFELPGSPVQLMVEVPQDEHLRWQSGMFCEVPDVDAFVKEHAGFAWVGDAFEIPGRPRGDVHGSFRQHDPHLRPERPGHRAGVEDPSIHPARPAHPRVRPDSSAAAPRHVPFARLRCGA